MKTKLFLTTLLAFSMLSCSDDENLTKNENPTQSEEIILKERTSKEPFILKLEKTPFITQNNSDVIDFKNYLGRVYNLEHLQNNVERGIKFPVIDINRYANDRPDALLIHRIAESTYKSTAFKTFSERESKVLNEKIRNVDGNTNFTIYGTRISLGVQTKYTKIFTQNILDKSNLVFGQLDIGIIDRQYELFMSPNTLELIKAKYLSEMFLSELYNNNGHDFLNNYGRVVLSNFFTGGLATAIYVGDGKYNRTETELKRDVNYTIDGSVTFPLTGSGGSTKTVIGNKNENKVITTQSLNTVLCSVQTFGGAYGVNVSSNPNDVNQTSIDLTSWYSSLSERNNTVMTDVAPKGLIPIHSFIAEENIKFYINNIINKRPFNGGTKLVEPRIVISNLYFPDTGKVIYNIALQTRFTDYLLLTNDYELSESQDEFNSIVDNFLNSTKLQSSPFKNLKIVKDNFVYYVAARSDNYIRPITNFEGNNFYKFTDQNTNMTYLHLNEGGTKFAYAIKDQYILDTYGIKDWVDSLTEKPLDYRDFKNYTIIAL